MRESWSSSALDVGIEGSNGGEVVVALLHSVDASCDDIIAAGEILPPSLVSVSTQTGVEWEGVIRAW